jgi:PLP dependent protein
VTTALFLFKRHPGESRDPGQFSIMKWLSPFFWKGPPDPGFRRDDALFIYCYMDSIISNLATTKERLSKAALTAGRDEGSVRLVAVSKFQPEEAICAALEAGHRLFGENRVQEAKAKFMGLRATWPGIELHLIGALQTNKADDAVRVFDVIETLDRPELAEALAKAMKKAGRTIPCYIEINSGGEAQKAGIAPSSLGDFLRLCRDTHKLTITGLMCIPPQAEDPRPYFRELKRLAEAHGLPHVSMGMSADFEAAIAEGATEVRIGTAIFGERKKP